MIKDLQVTHDKVRQLFPIEDTRYENMFKIAIADNKYYFYNIIKQIVIPADMASDIYFEQYVTASIPWTTFAHNTYGDQNLWWLICIANGIKNPTLNPVIGKTYKIIKPTLVSRILSEITRQLK